MHTPAVLGAAADNRDPPCFGQRLLQELPLPLRNWHFLDCELPLYKNDSDWEYTRCTNQPPLGRAPPTYSKSTAASSGTRPDFPETRRNCAREFSPLPPLSDRSQEALGLGPLILPRWALVRVCARLNQVRNRSLGNMEEEAPSTGHEASPQSGLGVGCKVPRQ